MKLSRPFMAATAHSFDDTIFDIGGELDSTGLVEGCWRAGVVWGPVNKPGAFLFGESNYAMAA